jgi:hypothetical protein
MSAEPVVDRRSTNSGTLRWIAAAVAASALAVSFVWTPSAMPKLELCLMRRFTGVPCPGCGLSRAFCAISHGELGAAWTFNPFGFAFYALALALVAWPFVARASPQFERTFTASPRFFRAGVLVFALMLVFGVVRAYAVIAAR